METNQTESSPMSPEEEIALLEAQLKGLRRQSVQNNVGKFASPQIMLVLLAVAVIGFMFMDSRGASNPQTAPNAPAGIAQQGETAQPNVREFDVVLQDSIYTPGTITVKQGDVVTINVDNRDNLDHGLHLPEYGVSQALTNLAVTRVTFVATQAGTAATSCGGTLPSGDPHPESLNIIVV